MPKNRRKSDFLRKRDGPTDRRTNGPTDRRTDGRTHPLIESQHATKNQIVETVSDCLNIFNVKDIQRLLLASGTVKEDYFAQEDYEEIDDSDKTEAVR